jgi:hypothetical protein
MSAQAAGRAVNAASKAAGKSASEHVLNKGAKRDPELYVCTQISMSSTAYRTSSPAPVAPISMLEMMR